MKTTEIAFFVSTVLWAPQKLRQSDVICVCAYACVCAYFVIYVYPLMRPKKLVFIVTQGQGQQAAVAIIVLVVVEVAVAADFSY